MFIGVLVLSALLGVVMVLPIGGADMPVVISMLNAFTGLAAAVDRLRARQHRADHRRHARRRLGHAAHAADGEAMNRSLAQRAVRRLRRAASAGRGAGGGRRAAAVRETTADDVGDRCSPTREAWSSCPATAWRSRRPSTPCASWPTQLEKRGVEVQLRDPPGRGPHARPHERAARRGRRPLHAAEGDGRDQPGVPAHRRGAGDRRERRHEPGRARRRVSPIYGMPILDVDKAAARRSCSSAR